MSGSHKTDVFGSEPDTIGQDANRENGLFEKRVLAIYRKRVTAMVFILKFKQVETIRVTL